MNRHTFVSKHFVEYYWYISQFVLCMQVINWAKLTWSHITLIHKFQILIRTIRLPLTVNCTCRCLRDVSYCLIRFSFYLIFCFLPPFVPSRSRTTRKESQRREFESSKTWKVIVCTGNYFVAHIELKWGKNKKHKYSALLRKIKKLGKRKY